MSLYCSTHEKNDYKRGSFSVNLGGFYPFFQDFPTRFFSKVHGKVPMGSEKPTDIVVMLRHFFRVTAVKGCAWLSPVVTYVHSVSAPTPHT